MNSRLQQWTWSGVRFVLIVEISCSQLLITNVNINARKQVSHFTPVCRCFKFLCTVVCCCGRELTFVLLHYYQNRKSPCYHHIFLLRPTWARTHDPEVKSLMLAGLWLMSCFGSSSWRYWYSMARQQ